MKNFAIYILLILSTVSLGAQNRVKSGEVSTSPWWFGANLGLDFGSSGNSSVFYMGLFPMVGYKLLPSLSIGPRVGFAFESHRVRVTRVEKVTLFNLSEAAFARFKMFNYFFIHGEFEIVQLQQATYDYTLEKFRKSWSNDENAYIGLGYNSGGVLASEIYILYNFLQEENTLRQPFQIRAGLTYNF